MKAAARRSCPAIGFTHTSTPKLASKATAAKAMFGPSFRITKQRGQLVQALVRQARKDFENEGIVAALNDVIAECREAR